MAIMTDEQRIITYASVLRNFCADEAIDCTQATTRDALLAAVNAADQWMNDNVAGFNAALPEPFASTATATQKTQLFIYVIQGRHNVGVLD